MISGAAVRCPVLPSRFDLRGNRLLQAHPAAAPQLRPASERRQACRALPEAPPDSEFDAASRWEGALRALPLAAGAAGITLTLANRILSGVAPVADASSAQSRADVALIGMAAVLGLTGLQWLALAPRQAEAVPPGGATLEWIDPGLPQVAAAELQWAFEALQSSSRCVGLVAFKGGRAIAHLGAAAADAVPGGAQQGELVAAAVATERGNYLANLILYPGRFEFFQYLPRATQGVALAPCGDDGCLVAAVDAVRGFSRTDQAWLAVLADKIDSTLQDAALPAST